MPDSSLAGMLALVLFIASVLTAVITASLLRRYRRAVQALSREAGDRRQLANAAPDAIARVVRTVSARATRLGRRGRIAKALGGRRDPPAGALGTVGERPGVWRRRSAYALLIAVAWSANSEAFGTFPLALQITIFVLVVWIYCWPVVLTLNVVTAATLRQQWTRYLLYGAGLLLLVSGTLANISTFLAVAIAVPTLVALALLQQGVRIVAPLVFVYMVVWIGAIRIAAGLLTQNADQALLVEIAGAFAVGALAILGHGWRTLAPIDWLYRHKLLSDEALVVDAVWLSYTLFVMTEFSVFGTIWTVVVLGCFVSYKLLVLVGFALVDHLTGPKRNHRLLLLRVFGSNVRSERLLAKLGRAGDTSAASS